MSKRIAFFSLMMVCAYAAIAVAQTTERVSVSSTGGEATHNGIFDSTNPSISADGRFVAFESDAANLVPGVANGVAQIYVHDRQTGRTEIVSVGNFGAPGNGGSIPGGGSFLPSISADGRFVCFESYANNLVSHDTNNTKDIFVRDRIAGTTELVSVSILNVQGNDESSDCQISANGRFVAFESSATNLVPSVTNGARQVYLHDRQTGATERISVGAGGLEGNGDSSFLPGRRVSADGRFVVFDSKATNLATPSTLGRFHIYVRDRVASATERIDAAANGSEANDFSLGAEISSDGRFVGFSSSASNLITADTNGKRDVFVRDRLTGTIERVSVASDGTQANDTSSFVSLSSAGHVVAFISRAANLVPNDTNGISDVFVHVAPGAGPGQFTLWLGNDTQGDVFQTDANGTIFKDIPNQGVTGIAFDGTFLYFSEPSGITTQRTADGSAILAAFSIPSSGDAEDLAWDSKRQRLWRIDHFDGNPVGPVLRKINFPTGTIEQSYPLPSADSTGSVDVVGLTPLGGLGVAYDSKRDLLYVSFCKAGCARLDAGLVRIFDPNTGQVVGDLFRTSGFATGGLAYDPVTDTLWVGDLGTVRHMTLTGQVLSIFDRPQPGSFVDGLELVSTQTSPVPCAVRVLCAPLQPTVVQPIVSGPPYPTSALLIDFGAPVSGSNFAEPITRLGMTLNDTRSAGPCPPAITCGQLPIQLDASGSTILAQLVPPVPITPPSPILPDRATFDLLVQLLQHPLHTIAPVLVPPTPITPPNPIVPVLTPPDPIVPPNPIVPSAMAFDVRYDGALAGQGTSAQNLHFAIGAGQPLRFTNVVVGPPQSPAFHVTFTLERTGGTVSNAPLFTVTPGGAFGTLPACAAKQVSPESLWPPNHSLAAVNIFASPIAGRPSGQIHVLAVNQDEPVNGIGDGDLAPDAVIQQRSTGDRLWLRAERAGTGDGRVYHVTFTAGDGAGNRCLDEVRVFVPHDAAQQTVGNGGPLHDSLAQ